ncbi:MAG: plasmid pRiA4b ORF-3 family protein [Cryomorphaceae bacterium]|nr:plasmid pRiA4b ORF-3 family protein [Cryomorphaceae bacterium]
MPTLTFQIKLMGTEPLVTRTFKVSSESSMYVLHHIMQVVMGWKNYHLYQFEVGELVIADKRLWDEDEMGHITDAKEVSVGEVFTKVGNTAVYEYDFGDGWMHHLELVDRSIHPTQQVLPLVISGENACPPEDCGGIHGYQELLEVLKNPKHPEYRETKVWVGSKFNPTKFSVDAHNKELGKLNKYIKEYENGF